MSYTIIADCTGCAACVKVCPVDAILGERKAQHTIDSAICIDCGACGRICPFKAVLDNSGALCVMVKRSLWPQPLISEVKCISCGVCLEVCPTSVLGFAETSETQLRPPARLLEAAGCIGCAFCAVACPVEAIEMQSSATA